MQRLAALLLWMSLCSAPAMGQDLFELEVFPSQTMAPGATSVDLHGNGIPGSKAPGVLETTDHPFHVSLEVSHGWTERLETGIFLETAPVARTNGLVFAGGHLRSKYRLPVPPRLAFDASVAVEYGINRTAFDENRQTLELLPILERRAGRMLLLVNPEWSITIKGPEGESLPKLSASAKVSWQAGPNVATGAEYYWKTEALKHFNPDIDRHHFLLPVMDVHLSPDWDLNVGAGHCLSDAHERWVVKSIVGYRFHRTRAE